MTQLYNLNGVVVTDTAFITPNGDQYPIRNITSVKVRHAEAEHINRITVAAFACWFVWFVSAGTVETSWIGLLVISIPVLLYWYFGQRYVLLIGSGGVDQTSLSFPKREEYLSTLSEIAAAINVSIANLQKT